MNDTENQGHEEKEASAFVGTLMSILGQFQDWGIKLCEIG